MRRLIVVGVALACALLVPACAPEDQIRPDSDTPMTLAVPDDAPTIQQAVDAAQPGDTIEIAPGNYHESVAVTTDDLIIRGTDRNAVVLDGDDTLSNGIVVTADGVRVENLTVQDYLLNGVLVTGMSDDSGGIARGSDGYERLDPEKFPPLSGFAVRYVTATNNGLYGIYAFDAHDGLLAHNYASGSSDSGIYVGQCQQCNIVVRDNLAEYNAVGYEQANASDSVVIVRNRFSDNRIGMTLISDYQEAFVPLKGAVVAGNVIADNNNPDTPAHAEGGFAVGLGISGAQAIEARDNLIVGHSGAGVEITSAEDLPPKDNQLIGNRFADNGFDVAYTASSRAPGSGNCLSGEVGLTAPDDLNDTWTCPDGNPEATGAELESVPVPKGLSYRQVSRPGPQPGLPADDDFELSTATELDLSTIILPDASWLAGQTQAENPET